jgi:uncharacterized membrane protein YdjX (TVP38/TMEM64 family)
MLKGTAQRREVALSLGCLALAAGLVAAIPELRHSISLVVHGNLHGLRHHLRGLGFEGAVLIFALILAHAVLFFPAEIVNATAGFIYGFVPGLLLVMAAWLCSALIAYMLGRTLAQPLLERLLGQRRFAHLQQMVRNGGVTLLLVARLLPVVPASPMSYVAGASDVPVVRFSWTTVVGSLPITAAVCYLGSRAESLSASDPALWLVAALFIGLLVTARWVRLQGPERAT